jgi:hypothetical protein
MNRGGCPISSRNFKDGIEYVGGDGLQELHDEALRIRLATYNYKGQYEDPNPKHLGFIIEDAPPESPAVEWSRDRVDMYGYLSMVVATMQIQEKEIEALRRELAYLNSGENLALLGCAEHVAGCDERGADRGAGEGERGAASSGCGARG